MSMASWLTASCPCAGHEGKSMLTTEPKHGPKLLSVVLRIPYIDIDMPRPREPKPFTYHSASITSKGLGSAERWFDVPF